MKPLQWLFDPQAGPRDKFLSRWIFLRALAAIYFSAFFSLFFQICGLIGPEGILPANTYLRAVAASVGYSRGLWFVPSLLWLSTVTTPGVVTFAATSSTIEPFDGSYTVAVAPPVTLRLNRCTAESPPG